MLLCVIQSYAIRASPCKGADGDVTTILEEVVGYGGI